jgi:hypothetical protein
VIETMPRIPTLWDFKQRLKAEGREGGRKLFDAFVQMLEGSIVDASFVDAPRQRNDRDTNQRVKIGKRPEEFDTHPTGVARKTAKHVGSKKPREGRLENQAPPQIHYHTRQCPRQPSL